MTELILWKDKEMSKLRRDMERLFDRFCTDFGVPSFFGEEMEHFVVNLSETEDTLTLKAELRGIRPEDMDVSVTEDTLIIKGVKRRENIQKDGDIQRVERSSRSFSRTIPLPCRIKTGEVEAFVKNDILEIKLPKCAPDVAHGIRVRVK